MYSRFQKLSNIAYMSGVGMDSPRKVWWLMSENISATWSRVPSVRLANIFLRGYFHHQKYLIARFRQRTGPSQPRSAALSRRRCVYRLGEHCVYSVRERLVRRQWPSPVFTLSVDSRYPLDILSPVYIETIQSIVKCCLQTNNNVSRILSQNVNT